MTLDLRYQTYTDAIPATYLYHSRPAPSEPHHPAPLRIANLACLSAQSCLLYGKGRGYAVSQTKLAILHSSTTLHKVALHAIVGGNSQRHEFTANTNCHPTTVHYTFDKLRLHRVIHFMQSGVSILIPCPFSLCSATVGVKLSNRCTTGYLCRYFVTAIPATAPTRKERSTVG